MNGTEYPGVHASARRRRRSGRLATRLSVSHLARHPFRFALSAMGVAGGVALVVGVSSLGASVDASLGSIATTTAANANIEVRPAGATGLRATTVDQVGAVPGVVAAGGAVESFTRLRVGTHERQVLLVGVDAGIRRLTPARIISGTRIVDPAGIVLQTSLAHELGTRAGASAEILTPRGWRPVVVGGVAPSGGPDARIVVAELSTAQRLSGKDGVVDVVYARGGRGVVAGIKRVVGPAVRVGPPALRREDVGRLLASTRAALQGATLIALLVGLFLVYNTMTMAATERLQEAALLRAVGATRRQVVGMFVSEGVLLGIAGALAGVLGGSLLAHLLFTVQQGRLEEVLPLLVTRTVVRRTDLVLAGTLGVLTAFAATLLPARRVVRADPVVALRPGGGHADATLSTRPMASAAGVIVTLTGLGLVAYGEGQRVLAAGMALFLVGVLLLLPTAVPVAMGAALRSVSRSRLVRRRPVARLAVAEVLRTPRRSAFTAGSVLLAVMLVVGFSLAVGSYVRGFRGNLDVFLRGDLYVRSATWQPFGAGVPMQPDVGAEIARIAGVKDLYPYRTATLALRGQTVVVYSWPFARLRANAGGFPPDYRRLLAMQDPDAVVASKSLLRALGLRVGDHLSLPTPSGIQTVRIGAEYADATAFFPTLYVNFPTFSRLWQSSSADLFTVFVRDGVSPESVQARIRSQLGARLGVEVDLRNKFGNRVIAAVRFTEVSVSMIQVVAVGMAAVAVANTLLLSTLERRRELAMLRAVGMLGHEVRRMICYEALLVGLFGALLGMFVGTGAGYAMLRLIQSQLVAPIAVRLPWTSYGLAGAGALGLTAAASFYPARLALRAEIAESLSDE